ncbi:MAG: hypothetical protein PHT96_11485 [Syntrophorhabdaceae bacterium]|nr:hypothetical protein [Syntrophorhabdaceae bacterium]MDD4197006.1 hypothetical protein [Syntrophorhabdaceae bacterium]HOC45454.1 hypothetical protein [Syntrophorhabdaceae bacterium]
MTHIRDNDWAERACPKAVNRLKGDFIVRGCLAGFQIELLLELFDNALGAPHMASRSQVCRYAMFAARLQAEGLIKGCQAVYICKG